MSEETCACRSSRRSLARVDCVMAARFSDPSGFFTMRGGESSLWGGGGEGLVRERVSRLLWWRVGR